MLTEVNAKFTLIKNYPENMPDKVTTNKKKIIKNILNQAHDII